MKDFTELEERINYKFKKKNLLKLALTHSSALGPLKGSDKNNERLEFLGDSILEHIIALHLYKTFPLGNEGEMTKHKAAIVREDSLAKAAKNIRLGEFLILGKGEEKSNGRERSSILADAVEAVIAATYLDGGFKNAEKTALHLLKSNIKECIEGNNQKDYKTILQEEIQKNGSNLLSYTLISEVGPPHDRIFTFDLHLNNLHIGTGSGKSKKEAQQNAACDALNNKKFMDI